MTEFRLFHRSSRAAAGLAFLLCTSLVNRFKGQRLRDWSRIDHVGSTEREFEAGVHWSSSACPYLTNSPLGGTGPAVPWTPRERELARHGTAAGKGSSADKVARRRSDRAPAVGICIFDGMADDFQWNGWYFSGLKTGDDLGGDTVRDSMGQILPDKLRVRS